MKSCVFRKLLLLSHVEKSARSIEFDPTTTVIVGGNDTGKSSLIKALYSTFGADPPIIHPAWRTAAVTSVVEFTLDGAFHTALRHGTHFAIFDARENVLGTFGRVTHELAPFIASLFGFRLRLPDKKGVLIAPPPAYFFLPFYVDQDSGWSRNWSSFARLQQLPNWRKEVAEFHAGIRPNEYYELRGEAEALRRDAVRIQSETKALRSVRERVTQHLPPPDFDLDLTYFRQALDDLLAEAARLKMFEESYKEKLVALENQRHIIQEQVAITAEALKEVRADYNYAADRLEAHIDCPTCGATYDNGFAERFAIAADEDRLVELLLQLRLDADRLDAEVREANDAYARAKVEVANIDRLLATQRGEVTLGGVIAAEGRKEVGRVLKTSLEACYREASESDEELAKVEEALKKTGDKRKHKEIRDFYLALMREYLHDLDVSQITESAYKNMWSQVKEQGSDLPRSLLAFYMSYLATVQRYSTATFCPIVLDELNQQGQDTRNLPRMIEFVFDRQPKGSQLILGLEALHGVRPRGKVIELTRKNRVLGEGEYDSVNTTVSRLLAKSLQLANATGAVMRLF